jgi:hypothetical protein
MILWKEKPVSVQQPTDTELKLHELATKALALQDDGQQPAHEISDPRKSTRRKGRSGRMIKSNYGQWKRTKRGWSAWKERFFGKKKGGKGRYKPLDQTKKPYVNHNALELPGRCSIWHPQIVTVRRTHNTKLHRCMHCGQEWRYIKTARHGWILVEDWERLQQIAMLMAG